MTNYTQLRENKCERKRGRVKGTYGGFRKSEAPRGLKETIQPGPGKKDTLLIAKEHKLDPWLVFCLFRFNKGAPVHDVSMKQT